MAKLSAVFTVLLFILFVLAVVDSRPSKRSSWKKDKERNRGKQRDRPEKARERSSTGRKGHGKSKNPFHSILTSFHDLDPFSYFNFRWNIESRDDPWWEGPNVCENEIREVDNSTETQDMVRHFSTNFQSCDESETAYKCKMVQVDRTGRKVYTLIYECCHGYSRQAEDYGCPNAVSDLNLIEKAEELGLTDFVKAVKTLKLTEDLQTNNYTVFIPQNGAFSLDGDLMDSGAGIILKDAPAMIAVSEPAVDKALKSLQNVLLSHMVDGLRRSSSMEDEQLLVTGNPEGATIRINHFYKPEKLMTANCVPITASDILATNGVIHTVTKVLKPVMESLLDIIKSSPELSTLKTILASANYVSKLDEDGQMTLLAPTNAAFNKMTSSLRERLLAGDVKCLEKVLQNHLLPNVICAQAVKSEARTINNLRKYVNVTRTQDNKFFVGKAQVIQADVMATNGVLHIIDEVLVPDEALSVLDILEKQGLTEMLSLIKKSDLQKTLTTIKNFTIFAPTNEAIQALYADVKTKMSENQDFLNSVLSYHITPGVRECRHLHNNELVTSLDNKQVRVNSFQQFSSFSQGVKTVQCAPIKKMNIDACNGRINVIGSVMLPPIGNVLDVLAQDKKFSTFVSLIKKTDLADSLQEDGPMTILAPNNKAFEKLDEKTRKKIETNPEQLETFVKHHIFQDNLCCAGIFARYGFHQPHIVTLAEDRLKLSRTHDGIPKVGHAHVITCDQTATNGNVFEIDQVLLQEPHRNRWRINPFADWEDWDDWDMNNFLDLSLY
ncbi:transforming growth factor-beta-induced protein ig-h3-like [Biomphalaria glabrata]|uniref:Transforming growth factor-beta-induced protein ig-h3-like n=1 Tax=Biomphalaria glabrata TaxID=6526 RepID=A0A9W3ACP5_BIOGL|nr:transforming growth factor-beta-induced protein ig-h3-like [Biomphalaria glabrata]XP_055884918.1 transforming growth factor-beta-induced protein ig-h3-like [Biomphalaria glabrata]